jgi:hypothetical protein
MLLMPKTSRESNRLRVGPECHKARDLAPLPR